MNRWLAAVALWCAGTAAAQAGTTGSVRGTVDGYDWYARNVVPLSGATVTFDSPAERATVVTDSRGHYVIFNLPPGGYQIIITHAGYMAGWLPQVPVMADCEITAHLTIGRVLRTISHPFTMPPQYNSVNSNACPYSITHSNSPFFDTTTQVGTLLRFVPGVQVVGTTGAP